MGTLTSPLLFVHIPKKGSEYQEKGTNPRSMDLKVQKNIDVAETYKNLDVMVTVIIKVSWPRYSSRHQFLCRKCLSPLRV